MMPFFTEGKKNTAVVRSAALKKKKLKQAAESSFEKCIEFRLDIEATKAIKNGLDERIVALLDAVDNGAEGEESLPINAIDLTEEYEANMAFFGESDFAKDSEPKIQLGHKSGSPVKVKLTRIAIIDKTPYLVLKCRTDYTKALWNLIPSFFESQMVVTMMQFEGELFEENDVMKEAKVKVKVVKEEEEVVDEEPEEEEVIPITEAMGKKKKGKVTPA